MIRRQAKAARGSHLWSMVVEEELGVLGEGLGEEKEEEYGCFTLLDIFVACNTHPRELGSPGRADPAPIFLLR